MFSVATAAPHLQNGHTMTTTLYRAADRSTILPATFGRGACFSPERETAEAYTCNAGFGGEHLYRYSVDAEYVVEAADIETLALELFDAMTEEERAELVERHDLYARAVVLECMEGVEDYVPETAELARALADKWAQDGLHEVFSVLEDTDIADIVAAHWDWIVYTEPGVGACAGEATTTWRYYGDRDIDGIEIF